MDKKSTEIICTAFCNGKRHDFRLLKESRVRLHKNTKALVDTGYQGLKKLHAKTEMPKKKSKKNPLTAEDKQNNQKISRERVINENVIGMIKRFKIIADEESKKTPAKPAEEKEIGQ